MGPVARVARTRSGARARGLVAAPDRRLRRGPADDVVVVRGADGLRGNPPRGLWRRAPAGPLGGGGARGRPIAAGGGRRARPGGPRPGRPPPTPKGQARPPPPPPPPRGRGDPAPGAPRAVPCPATC